ncbi:MAG: hypothetical protein IPK16_19060 [Anaerolineales bacterium]|nr:hypothetical protein [Anaerolineales bacterium]
MFTAMFASISRPRTEAPMLPDIVAKKPQPAALGHRFSILLASLAPLEAVQASPSLTSRTGNRRLRSARRSLWRRIGRAWPAPAAVQARVTADMLTAAPAALPSTDQANPASTALLGTVVTPPGWHWPRRRDRRLRRRRHPLAAAVDLKAHPLSWMNRRARPLYNWSQPARPCDCAQSTELD